MINREKKGLINPIRTPRWAEKILKGRYRKTSVACKRRKRINKSTTGGHSFICKGVNKVGRKK